jgi:hypothetical protein
MTQSNHFVAIHRANPAVYRQLCARFAVLKAQLHLIEKGLKDRTEDPIQYAVAEAHECRCLLQAVLGDSPPANDCNARDWIGASGYIRLWEQLHRAEEVLIMLAPLETVLADAWSDQLRLEGSNIDNPACPA